MVVLTQVVLRGEVRKLAYKTVSATFLAVQKTHTYLHDPRFYTYLGLNK